MKIDITKLTLAADRLLATLTNRRHVAMVSNYRRHAMLEVSGRYEEILIPGMTVEEPEYWSHTVGGSANFKGMKAIRSLYPAENPAVGNRAIGIHIECADVAEFRVGDVENLFIGRESEPVGFGKVFRDR